MAMYLGDLKHKRKVMSHWRDLNKFKDDARRGNLPKLTWIEPVDSSFSEEANNDHPPTAIENGQRLMKTIYEALSSNAARWQRTVLVITYDEHGGFYDHVSPDPIPPTAMSATDQAKGFQTFGPRVPTLVLSPLVPNGAVVKQRLEHCSILRFICDWFQQDPLKLSPRVQDATSIDVALSLAAPGPAPAGGYAEAPNVVDLSGWEFSARAPGAERIDGRRVSGMERQRAIFREQLKGPR
jgi:phospholipase C